VRTRFSGDDAWKDWDITDQMIGEDNGLKMAAIFACIFSGLLQNNK
jgi:hypothetical protein